MATKSQQWEDLCEEHAPAMSAWRELFATNCAGMAAVYRGNTVAQPSTDSLDAQEQAREQVVEIDERVKLAMRDSA